MKNMNIWLLFVSLLLLTTDIFVYGYVPPAPKIVTFWGQNRAFGPLGRTEKSLALMCNDRSPYHTIVVGYVSRFFDERNKDLLPGMGFSFHCTKSADENHPALLYCPRIANDIRYCHEHERKILIGIGGPNAPSQFESSNHAEKFAKTIWHLFLGGDDMPDLRPFGSVKLDGINLYMDEQDPQFVDVFLQTLHSLRKTVTDRYYLLTVSPSCMFPDPYFGPGPKTILETSINIIDQIYIRYIDKGCCIKGSESFRNSLSKWKNFMSMPRGAEFYFAFPAAPEATTMESCYRNPQQMETVYNSLKWRRRFRGFCILDNSFDMRERDAGFTYSNDMLYYILPRKIRIEYVPVPYVIKVPVAVTSKPSIRKPDTTNLPPTDPTPVESTTTDPPPTDPPPTDPPPTEPTKPTTERTTISVTTPVNIPSTGSPDLTTPSITLTTSRPNPSSSTPLEEQKTASDDLMEINGGNNTAQNNGDDEEENEKVEDNEDGESEDEEIEEKPNLIHPAPAAKPSNRPSPAQAAEVDENENESDEQEADEDDEKEEKEDEENARPDPQPITDDKFLQKKRRKMKLNIKLKKHHKLPRTGTHHHKLSRTGALHHKISRTGKYHNKRYGHDLEDEKIKRHSYRHEVNPQDPPGILGSELYQNANKNEQPGIWNTLPNIYKAYDTNKRKQSLTGWQNTGVMLQKEDDVDAGSTGEEEEYVFEDVVNKRKMKNDDEEEFSTSGSADNQEEDYVDFYPVRKQHDIDETGEKKQHELDIPNVTNPYEKPNPPTTLEEQFDENRKYLDMLQDGMKQQNDKFNQDIINQQPMDPNKVDQTKKYPYQVPGEDLQRFTLYKNLFNVENPYTRYDAYQRDLERNMNLKGNMDQLKSLMESMQQNVDTANEAMREKQLNDQRETDEQEARKEDKQNDRKNYFADVSNDFRFVN